MNDTAQDVEPTIISDDSEVVTNAPFGPDSPHPNEDAVQKWWLKPWVIAPAAAILLLTVSSLFVTFRTTIVFADIYAAGTQVQPFADRKSALQPLQKATESYRFGVKYPDGNTIKYSMSDAGVTVDEDATIDKLQREVKQSGLRRFVWWKPMRFTVVTKVDSQKSDQFMTERAKSANKPAANAALQISNGKAVIVSEIDGSNFSIPGGAEYLRGRIARMNAATLALVPKVVKADIRADNVEAAKAKADAFLAKQVSFTVAGKNVVATATDIGGWFDISPVPEKHTVDLALNSGKVEAYITKISKNHIKPPVSEILTKDEAGVSSVLVAGNDGVDIPNKTDAAKKVVTSLANASQPTVIDLPITYIKHTSITAGDYPKWIVADITTKRMYAYEHRNLVRTFLVSAGAPKTPTVTGQYKIQTKFATKTMRGSNADGSRYTQPNVKYVNFFYRDYAIHGNYWRPKSYFGNINSSHGCVGIVDSDAKWIYDWAPIGTPVIVHK